MLFSSPVQATTAAGRTKGAFAVSPTGAATYTIPIWAPAGPHGMQPHIALAYNSQQGNGYVGVGWGLSGLSSIYRCNLTVAQDAAAASVALATSDGYCMDGQRLRLTGGTYGTANSTYQTEIANFVNVEAYGTSGNGPEYWEAVDKNGWEYTYGGGGTTSNAEVLASGSTTAISWQLSTVTDPYGNSMTVTYLPPSTTLAGMTAPSVISWVPASSGSSSYNYTMTFSYGTKTTGTLNGYAGGTPFNNTNILSSIAIAYQGTAVKTYYLTYSNTTTATSRYVLTQVQECAGTGTGTCLSPTSVGWQAGSAGVGSATALSGTVGTVISSVYDLNGDGKNDLVMVNSSGAVLVALGGSSGYGTAVSTGLSSTGGLLIGDVDGSGVASLVVAGSDGNWHYYKGWSGSAFAETGSTGMAVASFPSAVLADMNGDGRADLAYIGSDGYLHLRLNTSTGGTVSFSSTDLDSEIEINDGLWSPRNVSTRGLHFWGGAQEDVIGTYRYCTAYLKGNPNDCITWAYTTYALHYTGSTFEVEALADSGTPAPLQIVDYADYNDDGCTDILTTTQLLLSTCNGDYTGLALPSGVTPIGGMDWNGDGRRDVLVSQSNGYIGVVLATGTGLASTVTNTSIPYSSSTGYASASNLTGDGQDALVAWNGTSLTYSLHNSSGLPPDLLTSVADGYGNSASLVYVSIAQSNYVLYSNSVWPDPDYIGPMYVVGTTTFSDPSSTSSPQGTYTQSMGYYGALMNLEGRGFDGFYAVTTYDSRNEMEDYSYYKQVFPYTGMKFYENFTGGTLTFSPTVTSNTLASLVTLSSTTYQERYFAYFSNSTTQQYEVGGTENSDLITTTSSTYVLDNYGNPTSIVQTVTDNDPNSPYTGQIWTTTVSNTPDESTSPYCLSLFSQTQTAYTATSGAAVTITKTLTPDLAHCDYTQIVTQSNSGSAYAVTEARGYDAFGNVNSDTVTGAGMSGRLTSTNWGTAGQFPASVTDPSGAITQYAYNFSYGLPKSKTDPNGLTTSWLYDGFGRKTQETRPDQTSTTWSYSDCNPGCLIGAHGTDITHTVYAVGGSTVITDGTDYLDSIDRPLVANQTLLSGSLSRNELRYDSLGRISQRAFPCTWTSLTTTCTYWTTNTFDVLNRLIQSQRPISSTNSSPQSTSYAYAGRTTTVTDPYVVRYVVMDVNGWLRQTKDPMGYVVTLGYDAAGNEFSVTDSLSNTLWSGTYVYGATAFLTGMTDMDLGSWSFTRDALGEKTAWTDAKGQSFTETYDALSRPLIRKEPDLYTSWTWGSTPSAYNVGKLASVCTGTGTTPANCTASPGYAESETYDSLGRHSTRTISIPGQSSTFTYTWGYNSTSGLLSTLTFPTSTDNCQVVVSYGYTNGLLSSVSDGSSQTNCGSTGTVYWTANATNAAGQVTEETLGNGIVTNRSYDAVTGWLGSDESGVGGGAGVKNLSFLYDEVGDVIQRQDNNLGLTENANYDNDYRLLNTTLNGTQNLSITYASTGNITSRSDVASGATWTYSTTQKHAVTEAGSSAFVYSYDANGNALTRQGSSIGWTSYNYPTAVNAGSGSTAESVAFSYGPDRQRWQQVYTGNSTSETTDYVGRLLEVVTSGGVTNYRHYVYAGSGQVAVYSRTSSGTNTFNYVLSDHQGSASDLTSSTGTSVVNESFTPYGLRRNPTTWSGAASNSDLTTAAGITRQAYTFQTQMGLWMGMNHMNGRVQDSMIGRFLSADPYIPDATNTQSYNRYSYVNNNPLTLIDPTGFDSKSCPTTGCPGGVAGTPEQSSWSCYGDCGSGYANSVTTTVYLTPYNETSAPVGDAPADSNGIVNNFTTNTGNRYLSVSTGFSQASLLGTLDTWTGNFESAGGDAGAGSDLGGDFGSPGTGGFSGSFTGGAPMSWGSTGLGFRGFPPQGNQPQLPDLPPPQCEKGGGGGCAPQPTPPTTCPNGGVPSIANNAHIGRNIGYGMAIGGGTVGIGAAALFIYTFGFPEAEVATVAVGGTAAASGVDIGAALGSLSALGDPGLVALSAGSFGAAGGAAAGIAATPSGCP
jgi:RHS repeat-associated protein